MGARSNCATQLKNGGFPPLVAQTSTVGPLFTDLCRPPIHPLQKDRMDTEVLVVGAGPTGLFLAAELARFGVSVTIIDRKDGPSVHSKALAIHARTLEVFATRQFADAFVERGLRIQKARLYAGSRERAHLPLHEIDSAYPFLLSLPQSETEQLLLGQLQSFGEDVRWNTELRAVSSEEDGATAHLETPEGTQQVRARWVIGCDGAHSSVRRDAKLGWRGEDINTPFALVDAQVDSSVIDGSAAQVFLLQDSRTILFIPLPDGRQRVILTLPQAYEESALDRSFFQDQLAHHVDDQLALQEIDWISSFSARQRVADTFRRGRLCLAGDAAHAHSPVGGQGMNTGLQDAHNLAWKLAAVLQTSATASLVDTYDTERRPIAETVVQLTGFGTRIVGQLPWWTRVLRNAALTVVPKIGPVRRRLLGTISQVNVNYADSPLTRDALGRTAGDLRAGHFAPDFDVRDGSTLYSHLDTGRPVALLSPASSPPNSLAESDLPVLEVTDAVLEEHSFPLNAVFILRPDGYIGYSGALDADDALKEYLTLWGGGP